MNEPEKTARLGDEYDDDVKSALEDVLAELGATFEAHEAAVAGSQDIETVVATIGGHVLRITSETYVGVTIRGGADLVDRVARSVEARLRPAPTTREP
jgi:hypothetical protein